MIDNHQRRRNQNIKLNLNSEIDELRMQDDKNSDLNASTNQGNLKPEIMIDFEEVISSNLSNIYSNICQEPANFVTQNKIQFRQDFQEMQKPVKEENGKHLLPVDSNVQPEEIQRSAFRKPSLVASKGEKGKSPFRRSKEKFEEKQNNEVGPGTQKHVRIRSENTIKYMPDDEKQQTQPEERNPQTSFQNAERLLTELSRQFQYVGDFSLIRKEIVQLALSKNLTIMQNTSQFVTIKASSRMDYCQCLIKSCLNMEESGGIFQLKNSIYKRNKAKFIMVSGNEKDFLKFFRNFMIKLWTMKCLKLKKQQLVEFFVNAEKENPQMKQLKKQYTQLYNEFSGLSGEVKSSTKSHSQSLIASLKDNFNKLRSSQKKISQKINSKFKQVLEYNEKVNSKFTQLKRKIFSLDESLESDRQGIERELETEIYFHEFPVWKLFGFFYKTEFQSFNVKSEEILKNYSLRRIFSFLEIQQQYSLFLVQKVRIASPKQTLNKQQKAKSCRVFDKKYQNDPINSSQNPVPYQECIKMIESMNTGKLIPSKLLQKLQQFYNQLRLSYSQLYGQKAVLRTSSMDDELPVTIFILLMSELNDSRSSSMNILGKIKWLLKWIQHQQSNADVDIDRSKANTFAKQDFAEKKKILTTLDAAFVFVTNQWKEHEKQGQKQFEEQKKQGQQNE